MRKFLNGFAFFLIVTSGFAVVGACVAVFSGLDVLSFLWVLGSVGGTVLFAGILSMLTYISAALDRIAPPVSKVAEGDVPVVANPLSITR